MATFTDLVRAQKQAGKSAVTSLSGAYNQMNMQRFDPRNALFSRSGLMTALFPSLKGYQATPISGKNIPSNVSPLAQQGVSDSPTVLKSIARDSRTSARNSMMLPSIAKNMAQIVRIWGGTPAKYFEGAKQKEEQYETKFGTGKKGLPGLGKTAAGGGFNIMSLLGSIGKGVGGIFSGIGSIAGSLVGGAASIVSSIFSGIGSLVGGAFSGVFSVLGGALSRVGFMGVILAGVVGFALYSLAKSLDFSKLGEGIGSSLDSIKKALTKLYNDVDEASGGRISRFVDDTQKLFRSTVNKIAAGMETALNLFRDLGTAVLKDMYGFMYSFFKENQGKVLGMVTIGALAAFAGVGGLKGAAVSAAIAAAMAAYGAMTGEKTIEEMKSENESMKRERDRIMKQGGSFPVYTPSGEISHTETAGDRAIELERRIKENEALIEEKRKRTSNTQEVLGRISVEGISSEYEKNLARREAGSPTRVGMSSEFSGKGASEFITAMEGFSSKAYLDPPDNKKNQYSIGHGHLITENEIAQGYISIGKDKKIPVKGIGGKDTTVTREEAKLLLETDIPKHEKIAAKAIGIEAWKKLSDDQRTALTSIAFNAPGNFPSLIQAGLREAIMRGDDEEASRIIYEKGWKHSQGKYLPGLESRRRKEAALFASKSQRDEEQLADNRNAPTPDRRVDNRDADNKTPLTMNSVGKSVADFARDQMIALDKLTGGQLMKGSTELADMLRDVTNELYKELMNNPTLVDNSQKVVNNNVNSGGGGSPTTASAYNSETLRDLLNLQTR